MRLLFSIRSIYNDIDFFKNSLTNKFGFSYNEISSHITVDCPIDPPIDRRHLLYSKKNKHNIVMAVKIRRKLADFGTKSL